MDDGGHGGHGGGGEDDGCGGGHLREASGRGQTLSSSQRATPSSSPLGGVWLEAHRISSSSPSPKTTESLTIPSLNAAGRRSMDPL